MPPKGKLTFHLPPVAPPGPVIERPLPKPRLRRRPETPPPGSRTPSPEDSPLFEPRSGTDEGHDVDIRSEHGSVTDSTDVLHLNIEEHHGASTIDQVEEGESARNEIVQSTEDSTRRIFVYRDIKGVQRDIWQNGDGDGLRDGEFPDSIACTERFRFLQHDMGPIVRGQTFPPKYVVLDDKACYDILKSGVYTARERAKFWFHDFSAQGTVKNARQNRGRPVLMSIESGGEEIDRDDGCGVRSVAWAYMGSGKKNQRKYHFTGERGGYQEVVFGVPASAPAKEPVLEPPQSIQHDQPNQGGDMAEEHLQRTDTAAVDERATPVGANKRNCSSLDAPVVRRHKRPRVSAYLHATPSPPWPARDRRERNLGNPRPYGGPSYAVMRAHEPVKNTCTGASFEAQGDSRLPTQFELGTSVPVESDGATASNDNSYYEDENNLHRSAYDPHSASLSMSSWASPSPPRQNVQEMELALNDAMKKLSSRDQEVRELRSEIVRLREMYLGKLVHQEDEVVPSEVEEDGGAVPDDLDGIGFETNEGGMKCDGGWVNEIGDDDAARATADTAMQEEVFQLANDQGEGRGGRLGRVLRMFSR